MNINAIFLISEKTQTWLKAILIIFLVLILVFAIFGFLGNLIEKTMKFQGKKVDYYMTNVVISRVCDKPKDFVRVAKLKNRICFFKASITPLIFLALSLITWVSYHTATGNWAESIFDTKTGIGTLFYIFDFSNVKYIPPLGFEGIAVSNTPHFLTNQSITNYIIFTFLAVGVIWYLVNVQAYVARLYRISSLRKSIYSKDLSTIDITHFYNLSRANPYADKINQNKKTNEASSTSLAEQNNNQSNQNNEEDNLKH